MSEQLSLFTPEQLKVFEAADTSAGIKVQWSKAQDKRIWNMFIGMLEWALFAPVTLQKGAGWVEQGIVDRHRGDIQIERLMRVMKWTRSLVEETEQAKSKEELQEAYARLVGLRDNLQHRLTNWEVCFVLMECSMQAPLRHEVFHEYMRAFAHCFGLEGYRKVMTGTHAELLNIGRCEEARYDSKIATRFPVLDEAEREWMEAFNQEIRGCMWPGTTTLPKIGT